MLYYILFVIIFALLVVVFYLIGHEKEREIKAGRHGAFWKREKIVVAYLKKHRFITNDIYQEITGVSDTQATRDLVKFVEASVISKAKGSTRGIKYKSLIKGK